MEFGREAAEQLDHLDLSLPKDAALTTKVLSSAKKVKKVNVYVGCAKWGRPDWVGKIYPKGTKAANFLDEYAKQFNCIEFNAIYYRLPTMEQVKVWKSKVAKDFKFCPKFTDVITHIKRLKNAEKEVNAFLDVAYALGNNLGPIFLMPHPQMAPKHLDTIVSFVDALPKDIDIFVEFRHQEWFQQPQEEEIFKKLAALKRGAVIIDAAGRRDCVHMHLTTPDAFIRFVGNSLYESDYTRIDEWVKRIKKWLDNGLHHCYFFMHQHEELYFPELSKYLIQQMNKKCELSIPVPQFVTNQKLFE
jgi:uncharacterized protein YecE (DUF72 family)